MSERLIIKNFGPISHADLDIKRYTLLIGKQASGKSTIAKLLALFKSAAFVLHGIRGDINLIDFFKQYGLHNYIADTESIYLEYSNLDYQIIYDFQGFRVNTSESFKNEILAHDEKLRAAIKSIIKNRVKDKASDEKELFDTIYEVNKVSFFERGFFAKQVYIPADRILFSLIDENAFSLGNSPLPQCLREFGKELEFAKNNIKSYPIDFLNIKYANEGGKNRVYYNDKNSLLLSESASGLQAAIPLMLVVENLKSDKGTFIVEEPELNLFPTTQKQIISFLIKASKEIAQNNLIITTHSPYVLSSINILLLSFLTSQKNPNINYQISELVDQNSWIDPNDFNAFYCSDGLVNEIFDRNLNIISGNELDEVSEDIEGLYEELMHLYKTSSRI